VDEAAGALFHVIFVSPQPVEVLRTSKPDAELVVGYRRRVARVTLPVSEPTLKVRYVSCVELPDWSRRVVDLPKFEDGCFE
jgi:hypothetical protein